MEVGNASEERLDVVLVSHESGRVPALRIELWTFDQRGREALEPRGPRRWILPLHERERPDGRDSLPDLRRALSVPHSIKTRPIGSEADDPSSALLRLAEAVSTARADDRAVADRLAAVQLVARGLDDAVLFDAAALLRVLDGLQDGPTDGLRTQAASPRRATVSVPGTPTRAPLRLEMLRKADGWAIARVEPS
jgi:hypothetical protein